MSKKGEFISELNKLYRRRTHWLRSAIGERVPGPPPTFTRKTVDNGIRRLQGIASEAYANALAKEQFAQYAPMKRAWQVRGYGRPEKRRLFDQWYARRIGVLRNCVYVFWGKRGRCVYIGRTGSGGSRPRNHFEKHWFGDVRRIDVYPVRQASQLPKLECLAIHRFDPSRNKMRAARQRWTKKCPMCKIHRDIHRELRRIFRFK